MKRRLVNSPFQTPVGPLWNAPIFVLCLSVLSLLIMPAHLLAQTTKTTLAAPALFAVQLGTAPPVQILRYEGGEPVSTAIATLLPEFPLPFKAPSPIQYRDIVLDYLPIPGVGLNTVLEHYLSGNIQPLSGAIVIMDVGKRELSRLTFQNAHIRSVEFSDLDVTLTTQVPVIRISLAVPSAHTMPGSNQIVSYSAAVKGPVKSSFQLSIQSLETGSQKSVRVEPLRFTVPIDPETALPIGKANGFTNLIALLPESEAAPFIAWQQQLTSQGSNVNQLEKTGTLQWLSSDRTKSFLSLQLQNLGILSVIRIPNKPGFVAVEMYCEKVVPQVF